MPRKARKYNNNKNNKNNKKEVKNPCRKPYHSFVKNHNSSRKRTIVWSYVQRGACCYERVDLSQYVIDSRYPEYYINTSDEAWGCRRYFRDNAIRITDIITIEDVQEMGLCPMFDQM